MHHLIDVNVYLAANVEAHFHHPAASRFVDGVRRPSTILFSRLTELACFRLLTQRIAPEFEPLSNRDSAAVFLAWTEDERVWLADEPPGLAALWPRLALRESTSPKLWADAYLAAFAIRGRYRLVSFDRGFRQFEEEGLDLLLLESRS